MSVKTKRKLNGRFIALVCGTLLILISLYKVPHFINITKLEKLGYSEEAIDAIFDKGLRKTVLSKGYYSEYLDHEIQKESFNSKYIHLYAVRDNLNEDYFDLYERLKSFKGYSDEELTKLYGSLNYYDMIPLLVFDKADADAYINDCGKNNTVSSFSISSDYLHAYENTIQVSDPEKEETFVSKKYTVGDYKPEKLVPISSTNAIPNVYLESRALDAFNTMCSDIRNDGLGIYAVSGYKSYDELKELNDYYGDDYSTRPGFSDAQLGLSVAIVSSETESTGNFAETEAYQWISKNCYKYGFIIRYPEGKKNVTGFDSMPYYLRYVGAELAEKIYSSKLTFDEYFMYYIAE